MTQDGLHHKGVRPDGLGSHEHLARRDRERCMLGRVLEVSREQRVRLANLREASMTERTSPPIATVGRGVEDRAAQSNGGVVPWAK
jgi:hypothetical protein